MNLKAVSNDDLIAITEDEIRVERQSTLKIIKLFQEICERRLYLELGFGSFYDMATKHFGYCAGSAMRRINAMKLVREMPQFEEKIESGELSLSVASDVQSFFYQEAKIERPYSLNAKIELVEACVGKSRREVEVEFVRRNPEREKRESVHAISQDRLRLTFSISKDLNDKLSRLKDLLSHIDPSMTTESLIERLAELGLDKYDPVRKAERAKARKEKQQCNFASRYAKAYCDENLQTETVTDTETETAAATASASASSSPTSAAELKRTRYIPASERRNVRWTSCTFVSEHTGQRCRSTKLLQLDHIMPYAQGGANTAENLRWMCAQHNRFRAKAETSRSRTQ